MKVLALIPARSGSKGVKDKNIQKFQGKTLIEWAIGVAKDSPSITDKYISTDSLDYEDIALAAGAKSLGLRPKFLSGDTTVDVVIDLLAKFKLFGISYDYILLLQPTVPERNSHEIDCLFKIMKEKDTDAVVSVSKLEEPHPHKLKAINNDGTIRPFLEGTSSELARQTLPKVYCLTGAYYLIKTKTLLEEKTFMSANTAPFITEHITNIDTKQDLLFLEF